MEQIRQAPQLPRCKPVGFSQCHRSFRAIQLEYRLATWSDHVNMLGRMIVGVDHHPQAVNSQDRRHQVRYTLL